MTDEEEKLRLSRALLCKKELLSLEEDCTAEDYISAAYRCTVVLGELSKMLSPGSARNMLAGTFTPNKLNTEFTIPKSTQSSSSKKDAAEKWGPLNFPQSL